VNNVKKLILKLLFTGLVLALSFFAARLLRAESYDGIPFAVEVGVPVEQRVVEIHMSAKDPVALRRKPERRRKADKLPFRKAVLARARSSPASATS
jgi:hypothetical protein